MLINLCPLNFALGDATAGRDDTDRKARAIDRRANRTVDVDMINSRARGASCQLPKGTSFRFSRQGMKI